MPRFDHGDALRWPPVAMTRHRHPIEPSLRDKPGILFLGYLGERTRGFAGGEHDQAPARWRFRQMRRQAARWMRGGDCDPKQGFEEFKRFGRHHCLNNRCPAWAFKNRVDCSVECRMERSTQRLYVSAVNR